MNLKKRVGEFFRAGSRTWALTVPIHVGAFIALFVGALRLSEAAYIEAGSEVAKLYLRQVVQELAVQPEAASGHALQQLLDGHRWMDLRLFDLKGDAITPDGRPLGQPPSALEAYLSSPQAESFEMELSDGRRAMTGFVRIGAADRCVECHEAGKPLAIASMRLDLTGELSGVESQLRRDLGLLILVWALLVGLSTVVVQRSAQRWADRLAKWGTSGESETDSFEAPPGLFLDPATRHLQQSIRDFLRARRQREAEVADRMAHSDQLASLGKLAAGLAHEIKNPLAGIQGALQILREDLAPGESNRELCGQMLAELERVNQTLKLLLSSARPSAPRLAVADVRDLLEKVVRLFEGSVRGQKIRLQTEVPPGPLRYRLDAAKIQQVLINLVGNAIDAVEGEGVVTIRASGLAGEGGLVIEVEDDGPGIAAENLSQVFEPFFTTKFSGTGLGLAIARSLVEQHGGTLEVDSEPGRGTRFLILLPETSRLGE